MNIAVYCASSFGNNEIYRTETEKLIAYLAGNGCDIIFGASDTGLMSTVADTALKNGAKVTGVVPSLPLIFNARHKGLTDYIFTDTIAERRTKMIEGADAFIALPGGPGTLDEITEVICLARLGIIDRPCIIYNINGYYNPLKEMFKSIAANGFAGDKPLPFLCFSDNAQDALNFILQYKK